MHDLWGWYAASFAAEPFLVSAVATYVPLFLEQLARKNAVWVVDKTTPCLDVPFDPPGTVPVPVPPPQCVVKVLWTYIDTSSLPLYTFSFSVLVQSVLVVSMSGVADRGAHRKRLLIGFAVIGAVSVMLMYTVSTTHYYFAALLAIVANASFGAVSVCSNAYLPELVTKICERAIRGRRTIYDRYYGACEEPDVVESATVATQISGRGMAIGYGAALFVQILTMGLLYIYSVGHESMYMLQVVIALVGGWWLVFQIPVALYLPSNSFPVGVLSAEESNLLTGTVSVDTMPSYFSTERIWEEISYGWSSLGSTVVRARELRDVCTFLVGWFLLSDAVTTVNSTAILFARANLQMATPALAGVGLLTVCFGILGSVAIGWQRSSNPLNSLLLVVFLAAFVPAYGVLGFFVPYLGLKHPWEMFLLASWYGAVLGALNTLCRSIFSQMIPRGHETMFFALFSLTDKGSSVLGPAVTGIITDKTHNIRYTFYFLLCMTSLSAAVFSGVNLARGKEEAAFLEDQDDPALQVIDDNMT